MSKSDTFGWDLLFKVTQPQIRNNEDILICLVHWKLIHQGFKCVGVGEDTTPPKPEETSETLPEGWNASNKYYLRYLQNGKLYLLSATVADNNVIINMNRMCDNLATGTCINTNVVQERSGSLTKLIPTHEDVINKIKTELTDPMFAKLPSKEVCTQTPVQTEQNPCPLRSEPRRSDTFIPVPRQPSLPTLGDPFGVGVGRSDLDPFAPHGGGMLFQPPGFGPPRIDPAMPPGAVPPGARYDPFRPHGSGVPRPPDQRNPDHDHLPPPGYDDMFM